MPCRRIHCDIETFSACLNPVLLLFVVCCFQYDYVEKRCYQNKLGRRHSTNAHFTSSSSPG